MMISVPSTWREVDEADFEQFLKGCNDYRTTSYVGSRAYEFAHNGKWFAIIKNDKVWIDPSLLVSE